MLSKKEVGERQWLEKRVFTAEANANVWLGRYQQAEAFNKIMVIKVEKNINEAIRAFHDDLGSLERNIKSWSNKKRNKGGRK